MTAKPTVLPPGIPGCLKKRRLLNEKGMSPQSCREYGEKFLESGWWEDALDFFLKGDDAAGLDKLKAHCLASGDAFLLARAGERDPQVWLQVGEQALARGKLLFARKAFEQAGAAEKTALVESLLAGKAVAQSAT